jgi:hypothetical protein
MRQLILVKFWRVFFGGKIRMKRIKGLPSHRAFANELIYVKNRTLSVKTQLNKSLNNFKFPLAHR